MRIPSFSWVRSWCERSPRGGLRCGVACGRDTLRSRARRTGAPSRSPARARAAPGDRPRDCRDTQMRSKPKDLRGEDDGDGGHEATTIDHGADRAKARDRASDAPFSAEGVLDHAAEIVVIGNDDMLLSQIGALGGATAEAD